MGGRRRDIQIYQQMLHVYVNRRSEYMALYGTRDKRYLNCRKKIHNIHRAIKRWEVRKAMMKKLAFAIKEFIGVDVSKKINGGCKNIEKKVAKAIFVKYGMQNGISGTDIGNFVGYAHPSVSSSMLRTRFTRSFATNNYNREMYHRFLKFIKRN